MESNAGHSAPGSSIFDSSDVEKLSFTPATSGAGDQVSYWFGQKYFECVISQQVLKDCGPSDTPSGVDVSPLSMNIATQFLTRRSVSTVPRYARFPV